ncbi:hypothetical protein KCP74_04000 [Salmonella enterica subsp. enterica]|nr:hypothetical protein KCP74_04000 [Salmonella enterica subsp. enterica]
MMEGAIANQREYPVLPRSPIPRIISLKKGSQISGTITKIVRDSLRFISPHRLRGNNHFKARPVENGYRVDWGRLYRGSLTRGIRYRKGLSPSTQLG